jgi:hypothetical protein
MYICEFAKMRLETTMKLVINQSYRWTLILSTRYLDMSLRITYPKNMSMKLKNNDMLSGHIARISLLCKCVDKNQL